MTSAVSPPNSCVDGISVLTLQRHNHRHWTPSVLKKDKASSKQLLDHTLKLELPKSLLPTSSEMDCCSSTVATTTSSSVVSEAEPTLVPHTVVVNKSSTKTSKRPSLVTPSREKEQQQQHRPRRRVRFAPGTAPEPTLPRKLKKRKLLHSTEDEDATVWWTPPELRAIQETCARSVRAHDALLQWSAVSAAAALARQEGGVDRFSQGHRLKRKRVRWQMYETAKAVQSFQKETALQLPPEFLSKLLSIYSQPMQADALQSAQRSLVPPPEPATHDPAEMDVARACAKLFLNEPSSSTTSNNNSSKPSPPSSRRLFAQRVPAALRELPRVGAAPLIH